MMVHSTMSFLLILLCSLLCVTHAVPNTPNPTSILKRALVSETLCDDAQDKPITQFLYQAVVLANSTISNKLPDGTSFRYSTAYSNYFRDTDWPIVSSMYQQINDFTWHREKRSPQVWLLCSQPNSIPAACKNGKRIAFTDPDPYPYTWDPVQWLPSSGIGFCSSFFDSENPLLNRYPRLTTHGAAIPADSPVHSSASASTARSLKKVWDDVKSHGGSKPALKTVQNGPSYAAAALEWYFLTLCGRSRNYSIPT
ncbi:hypothetical protein Vi05172_g11902 [Venturia inaequalis]|nr:hypothetical protein Vi05172_g11902 [Venturia inaequalis]